MYKAIIASIALAAISATSTARAEVSTDGHWSVSSNTTTLFFGLQQNAANTDPTYLEATIQTTSFGPTAAYRQITGSMYTLDSAADLYIVQPGDMLTNALLDAGTYAGLVGPSAGPWKPLLVEDNEEFWVGARIRSGNLGDQPWSGFGWAHLRFEDDGSISLLGSAMAYNESSLVVGSVPEPESWALMGAGLGLVALMTRRQQRAKGLGQNA